MPPPVLRSAACSCCDSAYKQIDRRRFLAVAGGLALAALPPKPSLAQPNYEILLLTCTDPRVQAPTVAYMDSRELAGKYRRLSLEGAAIGAVAEQYKDAHRTFWEDLAAFLDRYQIKQLIALDHRDCAAAKVAYGLTKVTDKLIETETHRYALREFRQQVNERHPDVEVEIGLMALDGKVQIFPPEKKPPPPEAAAPAAATRAPETTAPADTNPPAATPR